MECEKCFRVWIGGNNQVNAIVATQPIATMLDTRGQDWWPKVGKWAHFLRDNKYSVRTVV